MSKENRRNSFWLGFLKVTLGIVLAIIALVVGLYLYLRYALGIDVIDIKKKINLLNKEVAESEIVTNPYTEEDAENGFYIIFNNNSVYYNNGEAYVFDKEAFDNSNLNVLGEVCLSSSQFASCANVCINNALNSAVSLGNIPVTLELKQLMFSNLDTTEVGKTKVNVNAVFKIDFTSVRNEIGQDSNIISNFVLGLIPKNIYITSNVELTINEEDNSYIVTPINTKINNLTLEQSKEILDLIEKVFSNGENKSFVNEISTGFINSLFIGSDGNGLLKSINGVDSFTFKLVEEDICIVLLPEQILG